MAVILLMCDPGILLTTLGNQDCISHQVFLGILQMDLGFLDIILDNREMEFFYVPSKRIQPITWQCIIRCQGNTAARNKDNDNHKEYGYKPRKNPTNSGNRLE